MPLIPLRGTTHAAAVTAVVVMDGTGFAAPARPDAQPDDVFDRFCVPGYFVDPDVREVAIVVLQRVADELSRRSGIAFDRAAYLEYVEEYPDDMMAATDDDDEMRCLVDVCLMRDEG